MSENTKNIHQRLAAVMVKVDYIKKDKRVSGEGGYMAVTHDVVASEVRPFFVENGILISPTIKEHKVVDTGAKTKNGTPIIRLEAEISVSFVNVDVPTDRETITVLAHANDQGDKAPGKALSYAVKYAILKILLIETGENEEGRNVGEDGMDADRIVEIEAEMKAETNPAALRELTEKARQEARDARDEYASKRLVKTAAARAAELGIKPEPKVDMPRARAETPAAAPARATQPPKAGEPASKGLIKTVRNLASQKDMSDGTLLQILEAADYGLFASIDDLTKEAGAHLLEAIKSIETARA